MHHTVLLICLSFALPAFANAGSASALAQGDNKPASYIDLTPPASPPFANQHKVFQKVSEKVHHVAGALVGGGGNALPPSYSDNENWPFRRSDSSGQYHVVWSDGTESNVVPLPGNGFRIVGGDEAGTTFTPIGSGKFAITTGDGGQQAVMYPMPNGGYKIVTGGGTTVNLLPRMAGGWDIDSNGVDLGSIMLGPNGSRYGFGSSSGFFSFSL